MNFSEMKKTYLRPQKELKAFTFIAALLVSAAFFVPYIIAGHGYFTFYGDFNVQQIPFYRMCHAAIKGGNYKWSFATDLGANFIGCYCCSLITSPFFWLTLPFPNSFVPYLMGPLLILKFACTALAGYLYIRRFTRTPHAAMLGSLLYAFSGFAIYNVFFNSFFETMIILPLLLLALELFLTENRRGLFAFTVAISAFVNYFFFFGIVVFCIIYYLCRILSGSIKFKISQFLWLFFESVLGLFMASAMLFPALSAVLSNPRVSNIISGWNAIMYGKEQIYLNIIECFFFPPDLPARPVFFPGADVKWSSLSGWLPFFGMTGVLTFASVKKKNWINRVLLVCLIMSLVPILNSSFYAFNTAYYARWFYMPILIMCLATAQVCEDSDINLWTGFKYTSVITVIIALVIGFFPSKNSEGETVLGLFVNADSLDYFIRYWITVGISVLSLGAFALVYHLTKNNRKKFIKVSTAIVCAVSVIFGNYFIFTGRQFSYDLDSVVIDSLIEGNVPLDGDKDTFRIDTYDCPDNTSVFLGYNTMNAFNSIVPGSVIDFYTELGIKRDVGSRAETDYPAIRSLLSVKYLLDMKGGKSFISNSGNTLMPGFEYVKTSGNYYVYENKNYVGYGFSYDYAMSEKFAEDYNGDVLSRYMLKAIILNDEQARKYSGYFKDISEIANSVDEEYIPAQEEIVYDEELDEDETDNEELDEEDIDEEEIEEETSSSSIIITDGPPENDIFIDLTDEDLARDCAALRKTAAKTFKVDNDGFTATVERDKKTLVFFSVPFDEGWSATVNGKPVDIERVNIGFMAVPVDSGSSTIRFTYETPGLSLGIYITGAAFLVFVIYLVLSTIYYSRHEFIASYPEGDKLLEEWEKYEHRQPLIKPKEPDYKSILDSIKEEPKPETGENITGGFTVNTDVFNDK